MAGYLRTLNTVNTNLIVAQPSFQGVYQPWVPIIQDVQTGITTAGYYAQDFYVGDLTYAHLTYTLNSLNATTPSLFVNVYFLTPSGVPLNFWVGTTLTVAGTSAFTTVGPGCQINRPLGSVWRVFVSVTGGTSSHTIEFFGK